MVKELIHDAVSVAFFTALHVFVTPLSIWLWAIFGVVMAVSVGLTLVNAWYCRSERLEVAAR
ncbi:hypothetical protein SAMN05421595_1377 [Austwickia chelonae]|uniref:Uncharacterized protein n=2 Tax=Austwickia TaxID=1184606 RepID=K6VQB5_9MICO|nr:hypothetical protein AUCHE_05_04520 [Austwickia chelonae NBRC 105200]SEW12479.1 hypothetical protein SAMN05421595_1377 [Austwickia chelonae]